MLQKKTLYRLALVQLIALFLLLAGIWLGFWSFNYHHSQGVPGHPHELGQVLGLARDDVPTPFGVYQTLFLDLPGWLARFLRRLLHMDLWLFGLMMLPAAIVLFSIGFDLAIREDPVDDDDEWHM